MLLSVVRQLKMGKGGGHALGDATPGALQEVRDRHDAAAFGLRAGGRRHPLQGMGLRQSDLRLQPPHRPGPGDLWRLAPAEVGAGATPAATRTNSNTLGAGATPRPSSGRTYYPVRGRGGPTTPKSCWSRPRVPGRTR